jgi:hypothetical protein
MRMGGFLKWNFQTIHHVFDPPNTNSDGRVLLPGLQGMVTPNNCDFDARYLNIVKLRNIICNKQPQYKTVQTTRIS